MIRILQFAKWLGLILALSSNLYAQDAGAPKLGAQTGLPIPRFVSLNTSETNMRHGPSLEYPVVWIYHVKGLPIEIIGESGHWRKVKDFTGEIGWLHYALLSGNRHVLILQDETRVHKDASQNSNTVAVLNKNVVASLSTCLSDWCEVEIDGVDGWLERKAVWGVGKDEVF